MAEIDETIKRIQTHKGVTGIIILNNDGIPLKTTMDHYNTVHITGLIHNLVHKARNTVRELDSQNELTFLRLRSKKHEIMCAPENEYMMVVIQSPSIIST
ncbi:dynein light chain roadblock-type 2-like [Littorina saxatilis]|uniref:Dynein light chain roadblock n=1 Tax=Littorina saxatilis TaxID=31220 RepID=A0AAN9BZC6_9CAEN